jgi:hypothetical protein
MRGVGVSHVIDSVAGAETFENVEVERKAGACWWFPHRRRSRGASERETTVLICSKREFDAVGWLFGALASGMHRCEEIILKQFEAI